MKEALLQFLQSIKPTGKGVLAVLLAIVFIPAVADIFLLCFFAGRNRESFFITPFTVTNSLGFIPFLCIYLVAFFVINYIVKQIIKKNG